MAPPKPIHLNKNSTAINVHAAGDGARAASPPKPSIPSNSINAPKVRGPGPNIETLVAMDLPGQPVLDGMSAAEKDDYIRDFQKRFPSLTSIEMVERDLAAEAGQRPSR